MKEICLSDSGSEHQATLTVVIKYHGERAKDTNQIELNVLKALTNHLKDHKLISYSEDNYEMELSVSLKGGDTF